jgi:hypothetical protein
MESKKQFMIRDHSGRGFVSVLPISHIKNTWDCEYKNDPNDEYEETLGEWLESADLGEEYHHEDDVCSIIRTV